MQKNEVDLALSTDPFVPVRLHLRGGKKVRISFRAMTHVLGDGVLVFKGMKEGTRSAKGYDFFGFANIDRIEKLPPARASHRRRKAS